MKEDIKRQWVEALRSGKYEQGAGALLRDGRYCCLGVLCDLAEKAGVIQRMKVDNLGRIHFGAHADLASAILLPETVAVWAGLLVTATVRVEEMKSSGGLDWVNDELRLPFSEIADLIEEQL